MGGEGDCSVSGEVITSWSGADAVYLTYRKWPLAILAPEGNSIVISPSMWKLFIISTDLRCT